MVELGDHHGDLSPGATHEDGDDDADDLSPVKEDKRVLSVQRLPRLPFRSSL